MEALNPHVLERCFVLVAAIQTLTALQAATRKQLAEIAATRQALDVPDPRHPTLDALGDKPLLYLRAPVNVTLDDAYGRIAYGLNDADGYLTGEIARLRAELADLLLRFAFLPLLRTQDEDVTSATLLGLTRVALDITYPESR